MNFQTSSAAALSAMAVALASLFPAKAAPLSAAEISISPLNPVSDVTPAVITLKYPKSVPAFSKISIALKSPDRSLLFSTEYPHSEGKTLLDHTVSLNEDRSHSFSILLPIRGSYELTAVSASGTDSYVFHAGENKGDVFHLILLLSGLFIFGFASAFIFAGGRP